MLRRPRLRKGCRLRKDEAVVLVPEGIVRLQGSGFAVLALCDGQRSIAEILQALGLQFPQTNALELRKETLAFIEGLEGRGVVEFVA